MNLKLILFLLTILLLSFSCKTKKGIKEDKGNAISEEYILKRMAKNRISKTWFSAQSKIQLESKEMNIGGSANIRMIKDSLIWMNVKKFGFEAGRVLITKDSVFVINRLNKTYIAEGISKLRSLVKGIPKELEPLMNLRGLQDVIFGNPVLIPVKSFDIAPVEQQYLMKGVTQTGIKTNYWMQAASFLLDKMKFSDDVKGIDMIAQYGDYQTIGDVDFSVKRALDFTQKEKFFYKIFLEMYNIEFDSPKSIKFDIPRRYTRMEL